MLSLSVVLPSIRNKEDILNLYESLKISCSNHDFELIVVGPNTIDIDKSIKNVKCVRDFGNVSRCVQIGASLAEGLFLTWASDDCLYQENTLNNCVEFLSTKNRNDGLIIRYFEAVNRIGTPNDDSYWVARTHDAQKIPGVLDTYPSAPVGMYFTDYFKEIGGLDCSFFHANMNAIDLGFRIINSQGHMYLSPDNPVMIADFDNQTNPDHRILDYIYAVNDKPLFESLYSQPNPLRMKIPFDNWMNASRVWGRFNV